jgi:hypothetical protein
LSELLQGVEEELEEVELLAGLSFTFRVVLTSLLASSFAAQ